MNAPYLFSRSLISKHVKSLPTLIFHCYKIYGKEDTGMYWNILIHICEYFCGTDHQKKKSLTGSKAITFFMLYSVFTSYTPILGL